ncbi:multidrug resistance efflux pump [Acetobacter cibinongensis NRIC 0482]|nr:multidrug resistance efflux pump [Acetobacter cibinongensis NRIC 0482]
MIAWLLWHQFHGKYLESTNNAYIEADIVTASPRISGYVDQVYVHDNEDVKAGQPLVHIDVQAYQAKARQAQARIEVARTQAASARASIDEQEAAIEQSHAQFMAAESDARAAREEVTRYQPLAKTGAETQEKLTSLRTKAAKYEADAKAARATWVQSQRHIATLQTQVEQALAQEHGAQAELDAESVSVHAAIVRAGIAGRVGDRSVCLGQYVQPGTRLLSIVPLDRLYITANFKETQVRRMQVGQPVSVSLDARPDIMLHGRVESLSPATGSLFSLLPPQNATGNFTKVVQRVPVRIGFSVPPELQGQLVAGLSVEVEVDTKKTVAHPQEGVTTPTGVGTL